MEISQFIKKISSTEGVSNVELIRDNVVKLDLGKARSKDFFIDLKEDYGFEHCSLISAVDNQPQFELVYHFSVLEGSIFIKDSPKAVMIEVHIFLERDTPTIDSVSDLWFGANWHEREAYDLMGIYFLATPICEGFFSRKVLQAIL